MRHGSGVWGGQQLPRESAGVHAQGNRPDLYTELRLSNLTRANSSSKVKLILILILKIPTVFTAQILFTWGACFLMKVFHPWVLLTRLSRGYRPGFSTDAEDMAGLLSVHRVSVQNHKKPSHLWPSAQSSAHHPALPHLAPVPQICSQVTPAWDRHPGLSPISQGACVIMCVLLNLLCWKSPLVNTVCSVCVTNEWVSLYL